jgi:hypothetical protein
MHRIAELTRGADAFARFLKVQGLSDAAAGELLGVTDVTVYHWRIGAKVPKDLGRRKILIFTSTVDDADNVVTPGISTDAWDDGTEAAALGRIRPFIVIPRKLPRRKPRPPATGPARSAAA